MVTMENIHLQGHSNQECKSFIHFQTAVPSKNMKNCLLSTKVSELDVPRH